ncbi:MAG: hypothetical protein C4551_11145 [Bacillota bacterium]|nr:MAG: hypothetical protein C4551_11145 [Bacillota bacterium]
MPPARSATILDRLLASPEPSIRYKVTVHVLGRDPASPEALALQDEIRRSARVKAMLDGLGPPGRFTRHAYSKWTGSHWVLATLADIGYPPGDGFLAPLRDHVYGWLLGAVHQKSIRTIRGRVRRCASQEANAVWYLLTLGLTDERVEALAKRLAEWQWPDGGWNCDKRPEVVVSSFMESLIPLRALALHARVTGNGDSQRAAERAAGIFLKRRLFRRASDGEVMADDFTRLHYPCYWHYDILFALKVMAETGYIDDPRCAEALDLLESKRLPDGGFPAEKRYWHHREKAGSGLETVDWGPTGKTRSNDWVTVDALRVLKASRRLA